MSRPPRAPAVSRAQDRADDARQRLTGTLVAIQARLHPRALAREAAEELLEAANDAVRAGVKAAQDKPWATGSALGALLLFLLREPINEAIIALFQRKQTEKPQPSVDAPSASRRMKQGQTKQRKRS